MKLSELRSIKIGSKPVRKVTYRGETIWPIRPDFGPFRGFFANHMGRYPDSEFVLLDAGYTEENYHVNPPTRQGQELNYNRIFFFFGATDGEAILSPTRLGESSRTPSLKATKRGSELTIWSRPGVNQLEFSKTFDMNTSEPVLVEVVTYPYYSAYEINVTITATTGRWVGNFKLSPSNVHFPVGIFGNGQLDVRLDHCPGVLCHFDRSYRFYNAGIPLWKTLKYNVAVYTKDTPGVINDVTKAVPQLAKPIETLFMLYGKSKPGTDAPGIFYSRYKFPVTVVEDQHFGIGVRDPDVGEEFAFPGQPRINGYYRTGKDTQEEIEGFGKNVSAPHNGGVYLIYQWDFEGG